MKRLVLIDGYAILHRAYHAFPTTLRRRKGEIVNAVYGFTRMLLTVLRELNPDYIAVAFDLPQPTFRHKEYIGYQAQRPEMDRELENQIKRVQEVIQALNIPIFALEGYEADDIIGTLAFQFLKKTGLKSLQKNRRSYPQNKGLKKEVVIVTGDKDILQLVRPGVRVYLPKKGFSQPVLFDVKKVKQELGIGPSQVVDYKALIGDASDNYPGVPGIGPKTARWLLKKYKDLDTIYNNIEAIEKTRPAVAKKLLAGRESAELSRRLARIVVDVPLRLNLKACRVYDYDQEKARKLFEELEFKSLIDKLPEEEKADGKRESMKAQKKTEGAEKNRQMRLI